MNFLSRFCSKKKNWNSEIDLTKVSGNGRSGRVTKIPEAVAKPATTEAEASAVFRISDAKNSINPFSVSLQHPFHVRAKEGKKQIFSRKWWRHTPTIAEKISKCNNTLSWNTKYNNNSKYLSFFFLRYPLTQFFIFLSLSELNTPRTS